MLADFPVAVTLEGERYALIARDVSTATFFHGFPNSLPMTDCFRWGQREQQERDVDVLETWMFSLLPRVVIEPALTGELVHRLGDGAFEGVVGYLHAVGWILPEDLERAMAMEGAMGRAATQYARTLGALADELLPVSVATDRPRSFRSSIEPFVSVMAPNIRLAVREIAKRARVRPSLLWQSSISEFIYDWRVLLGDEIEAAASRGVPSEVMAAGVDE